MKNTEKQTINLLSRRVNKKNKVRNTVLIGIISLLSFLFTVTLVLCFSMAKNVETSLIRSHGTAETDMLSNNLYKNSLFILTRLIEDVRIDLAKLLLSASFIISSSIKSNVSRICFVSSSSVLNSILDSFKLLRDGFCSTCTNIQTYNHLHRKSKFYYFIDRNQHINAEFLMNLSYFS